MVGVVLGLQWGDEGKGKIVDFLAPNYDIVARFQGGPNAGHTLIFEMHKVVLHHPFWYFPQGNFKFYRQWSRGRSVDSLRSYRWRLK